MAVVLAVAGSTGLVGGEAVRLAAVDPRFRLVLALARRAPAHPWSSETVLVQVVDFENLEAWQPPPPIDAAFCALGTTIKKAGSRAAFHRVDFDYPIAFAKRAHALGARHLLLVSALSAKPGSRIFYSRIKGELEQAIEGLGFPRVSIARPSLLLGERAEVRLGELIAKWASRLAPRSYRGVHAAQVASGLLAQIFISGGGTRVLENRDLLGYAQDRIGTV